MLRYGLSLEHFVDPQAQRIQLDKAGGILVIIVGIAFLKGHEVF
jgi:hypothetical protein